jgi:hypothetical protein
MSHMSKLAETVSEKVVSSSSRKILIYSRNYYPLVNALKRHRGLPIYVESSTYDDIYKNFITMSSCKVFNFVVYVCDTHPLEGRRDAIEDIIRDRNHSSKVVVLTCDARHFRGLLEFGYTENFEIEEKS